MSDPFISEIRVFAGSFAPRGWALCDGQLLAISQNNALFSLVGTVYGGDGSTTFGLPDLRGRIPVGQGAGPGLMNRQQGAKGGAESVALSVDELPSHEHDLIASSATANVDIPGGAVPADTTDNNGYRTNAFPNITMHQTSAGAGGSLPHTNVMPFLCVNYIISLFGTYPSET